jgi:hypothetical protein
VTIVTLSCVDCHYLFIDFCGIFSKSKEQQNAPVVPNLDNEVTGYCPHHLDHVLNQVRHFHQILNHKSLRPLTGDVREALYPKNWRCC